MIDYKYQDNKSDKLIVIFGGIKVEKNQKENFSLIEYPEKIEANLLFVNSTSNDSMIVGAPSNVSLDLDEFKKSLAEKIKELGFERDNVFAFGTSEGGYEALLHGLECKAVGHVISVTPILENRRYFEQENIFDKKIYIITGSNDNQYKRVLEVAAMLNRNNNVVIYDSIDCSLGHDEIPSENSKGIYDFLCSLVVDNKTTVPVGFKKHVEFEERLGIICDINWYQMFTDCTDLIYVTPENVDVVMGNFQKALYITPWHGVFGEYKGPNGTSVQNNVLEKLKANGKEIIFYSKEDPVNYKRFYEKASLADVIYTSSRTAIKDYRNDCKCESVNYMPYHINPRLFNPTYRSTDESTYHFAGSYMADKYEDRKNDFDIMYNNVVGSEKRLFIRDRNSGRNLGESFEFPEKFRAFVRGALKYEELSKEQCEFQRHINMNSVKFDQDMCAVRIFELQAAGKTVFSNFSLSVSNKFPNVNIVSTEYDLEGYDNIHEYDAVESDSAGVRNIFSKDLTVDGFIEKINGKSVSNPEILVVFEKEREFIQSYKQIKIIKKCKLNTINMEEFDYICFIGDENYSYYYIEDLVNGFKFSNTNVVSTNRERHFETLVCKPNPNCSMYKITKDFSQSTVSESQEVLYVSKTTLLEKIAENKVANPVLSIIIPVYNNGKSLRYRCLKSLKKLKNYKEYEIILVDDGSTDEETLTIIREEEYKYSNVRSFVYKDGGSGSASRPRNKGLDIATGKYIAYLDPDNELIGTGFEILLEKVMQENLDFCFGKSQVLGDSVQIFPKQDISKITSKTEFFDQLNYSALSIQGAVFEADFLRDKVMENPEGLIGQDTLFCYDVICNGKKFECINRPIHKYYNRAEGSVTNSMTIERFRDGAKVEKIKKELFEKADLLDHYVSHKNEDFIKQTYFKRLRQIPMIHVAEAAEIIREIIDIYGINNINDSFLRDFYFKTDGADSLDGIIGALQSDIYSEITVFKKNSQKKESEYKKKINDMRLKNRVKRLVKKLPFLGKSLN